MKQMTQTAKRCRDYLIDWYAKERLHVAGPANLGLFGLVEQAIKNQTETSESTFISLVNATRGVVGTPSGGELHHASANEHLPKPDDIARYSDWPTQAYVAKQIGVSKPTVARMIKRGELKDNGKKGNERRVDPASFLTYCKTTGIVINEDADVTQP